MLGVIFSPEQDEEVAATLAHCKTLVDFSYAAVTTPQFYDYYCVALSNNFDTKLERLLLNHGRLELILNGDRGIIEGTDAATVAKIRTLLKLNVQRSTCPPLFAAIGNAETDATCKQCLVKAFEAVDIPVVFEYFTANQNNMIERVQRLGRSRKRQRED